MNGIDRVAFHIFSRPVYWYGILMTLAVVVGYVLTTLEAKRRGLDPEVILDLAILLIPVGVVGARVYYVLFSLHEFTDNFWRVFFIWEGGLAIYGTLIACVIALYFFCHRKKYSFWLMLDTLAPSVVIAQAIGRWGNFFNQEVYGLQVLNPEMQFFPFAVHIGKDWFLALFFYEFLWNTITFLVLCLYRKKPRHAGNVFVLYVTMYAAIRAVLEGLRVDTYVLKLGGIAVSQIFSVILVVIGIIILVIRSKRPLPENSWRFTPVETPQGVLEGEDVIQSESTDVFSAVVEEDTLPSAEDEQQVDTAENEAQNADQDDTRESDPVE